MSARRKIRSDTRQEIIESNEMVGSSMTRKSFKEQYSDDLTAGIRTNVVVVVAVVVVSIIMHLIYFSTGLTGLQFHKFQRKMRVKSSSSYLMFACIEV